MKIVSKHPYIWPHLGFALVAGENNIDESDIPLAAHGKLEHLSKRGTTVGVDSEGKAVTLDVPGPISGYEPSAAFVAAAEKHNPKRAAARMPKVATLKTLAAAPSPSPSPSPSTPVEPDDDDSGDDHDVELSEEALGKLSFKDLQRVAAKADIDVNGLTAKRQLIDKLLAASA